MRVTKTKTNKTGFMGSTVSFSHPDSGAEFPTNLNVVVQDMGNQPMTLEQFCDMLKQQLEVLLLFNNYILLLLEILNFVFLVFCEGLQHGERNQHGYLRRTR